MGLSSPEQMLGADERGHPVLVIAEGSGNKSGKETNFKALVFAMLATLTVGMELRKLRTDQANRFDRDVRQEVKT